MLELLQKYVNEFNIWSFIVFFLLNLIYVILGCLKDILRQKGTKSQSSNMSALCYGFYIIILKQISGTDMLSCVLGTIISNKVGDYLGRIIADKIKPRPCTSFEITLSDQKEGKKLITMFNQYLLKYNMGYFVQDGHKPGRKYSVFKVYTKDTLEDKLVLKFIDTHKIRHWHIVED